MNQIICQTTFWLAQYGEKINFFGIYTTLFVGFLTFISVLAVAVLYRRSVLLNDLHYIKDAGKTMLQEIKDIEKENSLMVYEPSLLETGEVIKKIEANKFKLSKENQQVAERLFLLLNKLRDIENNIKNLFGTFLKKNIFFIIIPSLILVVVWDFLGSSVNFVLVAVLLIYSIKILWWDFRKFLKDIDVIL